MQQQDGYCDHCGCELNEPQITIDGQVICAECVNSPHLPSTKQATKPEARDDGR